MPITLNGTYTSTYTLSNPATQNPATINGLIDVNSTTSGAIGLDGNTGFAWTITNLGTVESVGSQGTAIDLLSGGLVTNGTSGSTAGLIIGNQNGVFVNGGAGTVTNYGFISAIGSVPAGNFATGVILFNGGRVNNLGTIQSTGTAGTGINLQLGGSVTNGQSGSTAGLIIGSAGIFVRGGAGTVANYGTISAIGVPAYDIQLQAGGSITNFALISAADGTGIQITGGVGSVVNFGTIESSGNVGPGGGAADGVNLNAGGVLTNSGVISSAGTNGSAVQFGAAGGKIVNQPGGLITAYHNGVGFFFPSTITNPGILTIVNQGVIASTQPGTAAGTGFTGFAINAGTSSTTVVENFGTIVASETVNGGGILLAGGQITNELGGLIDGAGGNAITVLKNGGNAVIVTNFGTIANATGSTNSTIYIDHGGIVTNDAGALIINTTRTAISFDNNNGSSISVGTVVNAGTIVSGGTAGGSGIYFGQGGTVINQAGGLISAYLSAVNLHNTAGLVVNSGTIVQAGTGTSGTAVYFQQGGTVINSGLIVETRNGAPGNAPPAGYPGAVGAKNQPATVSNFGTIEAVGNSNGVNLGSGGVLINGSPGAIAAVNATPALIYAPHGGVYIGGTFGVATPGAIGTVINYGTIESTTTVAAGVRLVSGGTVTNHGLIASARTGISFGGTVAGTVDNFGTVVSTAPTSYSHGTGVYLQSGGLITNEASAVIAAYRSAVVLGGTTGAPAIVSNAGIITGSAGISISLYDTGSNTIVNYGTVTGTGGIAIALGGGPDQVVIEGGSQLYGAVGNFQPGDSFDLPFLAFDSNGSASLDANKLEIVESSGTFSIVLDPSQNFASDLFHLSADGSGGTLVTETGGQPAPRDFNGDGLSDILWQNDNGSVAIWEMNGTGILNLASDFVISLDSTWHIAGTGDFNGDGTSDMLWQNDNGSVAIWEMNGTSILNLASDFVTSLDPSWHIRGTGDFNGDGKSDMLWQNDNGAVAIWEMNGTSILNLASDFVISLDASWHIRGTGDFNGDGTSDILWQNDNGSVAIWEMNGTSILNLASDSLISVDPSWHIRGTGDFNGDGNSDILWQNDNGAVAIWEMNGTSILNLASDFVISLDPTWHIRGTGDYNGDGKSDILWQNDNGSVAIWEMNGTSILNLASDSLIAVDPSWHIIPPDNTGDIAPAAAAAASNAGFGFNDLSVAPAAGDAPSSAAACPPSSSDGGWPLLSVGGAAASPVPLPAVPATPTGPSIHPFA